MMERVAVAALLLALALPGVCHAQKRAHAPEADLAAMVEIGPITFRMGQEYETPGPYGDAWYVDQLPGHDVTLSGFYLDVTEVTVGQFALFLTYAAGEYHFHPDQPIERVDGGYLPVAGREHDPVTHVTWEAASHYCLWAGKRLPTEAEWESAATGLDGREYPWGDEGPDCARAVHFTGSSFCEDAPAAVGSRPAGATPEGVMDLAGNVGEWVADWYGFYTSGPGTDPTGPAEGTLRVVRGGGYLEEGQMLRSRARRGADPLKRSSNIGFRCAYSADPADGAIRGALEPAADEGRQPTDRPLAPAVEGPEVLASLVRPTAIAEMDGTFYVLDRTLLAVYEVVPGSDPLPVVDGLGDPVDMVTDGTDLFVSDRGTAEILRVGTDGSSGAIATGQAGAGRLAAQGGEVFWACDAGVMRHTASGGVELLVDIVGVTDLALSSTHLYYTSSGGTVPENAVFGRVLRAGGGQESLMDDFGSTSYPTTVVFDEAGATAYFIYRLRSWPVSTYVVEYPESGTYGTTLAYSPTGTGRAWFADGRLVWASSSLLVAMDPEGDATYGVVGAWTRSQGVWAGPGEVVWTDVQDGRVYRQAD